MMYYPGWIVFPCDWSTLPFLVFCAFILTVRSLRNPLQSSCFSQKKSRSRESVEQTKQWLHICTTHLYPHFLLRASCLTLKIEEFRCYEAKIDKRLAVSESWTRDTSGLSRQCSPTEPWQPNNHQTSQSSIFTAQVVLNASVTHLADTHVPLELH